MASNEFSMILQLLGSMPPLDPEAPLEMLRQGMEAMTASMPAPEGMTAAPVDAGGIPAEWVSMPGAREDRAVLYLHGGGYALGSINTHRSLAARLSRDVSARVLIIDYRLAPEHPHPAAVEDAVAAYRFLRAEGFDAASIAIAGDSAGGGLTVATLLALRDAGDELPAAGAGLSPWLDLAGIGESNTTKADEDPIVNMPGLLRMAGWYLGDDKAEDTPTASPLFSDPKGLPPLLLQVGEAEILRDDSTRFAQKARAAGGTVELEVWPEMVHVWQAFGDMVPESKDAVEKIAQFLNQHLRPN
ncbi:MAG: alpha/beta hydrolase [Candidatus Binatia bacterium]|nr:alpha/beta hydrolase [Candidatus Binatia bacterium]